jgi:hypothetical protein
MPALGEESWSEAKGIEGLLNNFRKLLNGNNFIEVTFLSLL